MRTSNVRAGKLAKTQTPFKASNMHGDFREELYVIWSYDWYPIFIYEPANKLWLETDNGYSPSTKRHMLHIKRALDCDPIKVPHKFLEKLLS